ncbi:MAG: hypothetical protein HYX79_10340 [Chloroflexi bacterium]|nr:hypothetical protein [Chloroflexota bacterium]
MSENAYYIIEIKKADRPSFNLWYDEKLKDFINKEYGFYSQLNSYDTGIVEIPIKTLKKAIKKAAELDLDEDTVNQLKKDIATAKSSKDEYVTYYCC